MERINMSLDDDMRFIEHLKQTSGSTKEMIEKWLEHKNNDEQWKATVAEVKAYNKEIERIYSKIESDYEEHKDMIKDALDHYLRDTFDLDTLKRMLK